MITSYNTRIKASIADVHIPKGSKPVANLSVLLLRLLLLCHLKKLARILSGKRVVHFYSSDTTVSSSRQESVCAEGDISSLGVDNDAILHARPEDV